MNESEKAIECPCGVGGEPALVGTTAKADEYGSATQFAWSHLDHYFYLVVRAPFVAHGRGGSYQITMTDPGLANTNTSNYRAK